MRPRGCLLFPLGNTYFCVLRGIYRLRTEGGRRSSLLLLGVRRVALACRERGQSRLRLEVGGWCGDVGASRDHCRKVLLLANRGRRFATRDDDAFRFRKGGGRRLFRQSLDPCVGLCGLLFRLGRRGHEGRL